MHAAVAWLLRQSGVCSVIMGCSNERQVLANAAVAELTDETCARLSLATEALKQALGADADMWGSPSRIA